MWRGKGQPGRPSRRGATRQVAARSVRRITVWAMPGPRLRQTLRGSPRGSSAARVVSRPVGQLRALLAALERVEVVHVLVEDAERVLAVVGRAVARHDRLGRLHERRQAGERGAVVADEPRLRPSGSPRSTGSRPRTSRPHQRAITAMPSGVWPSAGCSSSSSGPSSMLPGHRQRLHVAERQRPVTLHVQLGVHVAQLPLRRAGLLVEPLDARLAHPERQLRERQPAEQVVVVGVGGQRARPARSPPPPAGPGAPRARPGSRASRSASPPRPRAARRRWSATAGW